MTTDPGASAPAPGPVISADPTTPTTRAVPTAPAAPAPAPATLDHAGIAARVPHHGSMCLLDSLLAWDAGQIRCSAVSHADAGNPLRHGGVLPSPCAIEYAAQAMALHGALSAPAGSMPTPGFLASARQVQLHVARLDDVPGAITVHAVRLAGSAQQALYSFALLAESGAVLVDGRAAVVLNTPLPIPAAAAAAAAAPGASATQPQPAVSP